MNFSLQCLLFINRLDPLWDDDWDDRKPISLGDKELDRQRDRDIRNRGITRHIILIRHGQYDETHKVMVKMCYVLWYSAATKDNTFQNIIR